MHKLLIGVVAATLTMAACGGSSKRDTSVGGTVTTASKTSGGATDTTAQGGSSGGGAYDLPKTRIKITYEENSADSKSMVTIALSGTGKSAFTSDGGTAHPASTIYSDGTTNVDCEGTGPTVICTQLPAAEDGFVGIPRAFTLIPSVVAVLGGGDKSSATIAGRDATCVKYKATDVIGKVASNPLVNNNDDKVSDYDASDTATICLDKQTGFLLSFEGTKKGVARDGFTATAVSEPTDADFTPPSTP